MKTHNTRIYKKGSYVYGKHIKKVIEWKLSLNIFKSVGHLFRIKTNFSIMHRKTIERDCIFKMFAMDDPFSIAWIDKGFCMIIILL